MSFLRLQRCAPKCPNLRLHRHSRMLKKRNSSPVMLLFQADLHHVQGYPSNRYLASLVPYRISYYST